MPDFFPFFEAHELAVESSQQVKDNEIIIITIGIGTNIVEEELRAIASSREQFLLFPGVDPPQAQLELISDEITTMICEGQLMS